MCCTWCSDQFSRPPLRVASARAMECNICKTDYDTVDDDAKPMALICQHTICAACVRRLGSRFVICPVCRRLMRAADIAPNFGCLDLLLAVKQREDAESMKHLKAVLAAAGVDSDGKGQTELVKELEELRIAEENFIKSLSPPSPPPIAPLHAAAEARAELVSAASEESSSDEASSSDVEVVERLACELAPSGTDLPMDHNQQHHIPTAPLRPPLSTIPPPPSAVRSRDGSREQDRSITAAPLRTRRAPPPPPPACGSGGGGRYDPRLVLLAEAATAEAAADTSARRRVLHRRGRGDGQAKRSAGAGDRRRISSARSRSRSLRSMSTEQI